MRLAVYHNQRSGGARRGLLGFCAQLDRRHELDLFTLTTADAAMLTDEAVFERVIRLPFHPIGPIRFGLYLNDIIHSRNLRALQRVNQRAAALIDSRDYDAVLVDSDQFTFAPYLLAYLHTPSVHYFHHRPWDPRERFAPPPISRYQRVRAVWRLGLDRRLKRRQWRQEVALVHRATRVVTNSSFTASRLDAVYGIRAAVAPCGVDLPQAWGLGGGGYLLSVGELEVRKGFDFVLDSVARIPADLRPPLRIIANAANSEVRRRIEAQAHTLGITLQISILPSQLELARAYRNAEVFVYGAHQEALGLAPLEAMAHGVPVVAVAEGGVPETVCHGRTGFLTARDPAEFGRRITELLRTPALRVALGAGARHAVERTWTWPTRSQALEAELAAVAMDRRPLTRTATR